MFGGATPYALGVTDLPQSPQDSAGFPLPRELGEFTKLLSEPVVTVGSSYRSGSHPVLRVKIAAEVSRSPKVGLISRLRSEGRDAFVAQKYRQALIKFLAIEELLRKYGDLLIEGDPNDLREELEFLKIHFYLLSGQAAEACRTLKNLNYKGSSYLNHRRYSAIYRLGPTYWRNLGVALRQIFTTLGGGRTFTLLGYVTVMGPEPYAAEGLSRELGYTPHAGDDVFQPFLLRHHRLLTEYSGGEREWLPADLAHRHQVVPLSLQNEVLFVGTSRPLSADALAEIGRSHRGSIVEVPATEDQVQIRLERVYRARTA